MNETNQNQETQNSDLNTLLSLSRETFGRLAISENGFVFDPVTGNSFMCNETALLILRQLQQKQDLQQLMDNIEADYQVNARDLERDLLEFAGQLREYMGI